jgi:hypothetical protein
MEKPLSHFRKYGNGTPQIRKRTDKCGKRNGNFSVRFQRYWHDIVLIKRDDKNFMEVEIVLRKWNSSVLFSKYEYIENWIMKPPPRLTLYLECCILFRLTSHQLVLVHMLYLCIHLLYLFIYPCATTRLYVLKLDSVPSQDKSRSNSYGYGSRVYVTYEIWRVQGYFWN